MSATDWRRHAACTGMDVGMFFGPTHPPAAAKKACGSCTVRSACLEADLADHEGGEGLFSGFRAGLSATARAALFVRTRRAAA